MQRRIVQVVGYKNSGKTTLICHLIGQLAEKGLRVGTVKHDSHDFQWDTAGTDTWKHTAAGAHTVAITSTKKTAVFKQKPASLDELVSGMDDVDVILVEGFKQEKYPKVLLIRNVDDTQLLQQLTNVIAVVSPVPLTNIRLPVWPAGQTDGLAEFLLDQWE
ncbi:molybdopterin-guanine dinucleotide biosynthesis protein B [Paenactinomyces guangxiensis]|uniref:molybdopterin-guanine dinucleotide biosynthesis protein B n=1 Tax=Paenactinomyces guangxiensis TaxID=1490290 RepID=UPI001E4259D7|nr:molybdopterin-guanine dinucleotide biosynthesis protein B [Paenactinomyces guangxiensis]